MSQRRAPGGTIRKPLDKSEIPLDASKTVGLPMAQAIRRFLLDRQDADVSAATLKWYRQKLDQLVSATEVRRLEDLSRDHLQAFTGALREQDKSPAYVRGWH